MTVPFANHRPSLLEQERLVLAEHLIHGHIVHTDDYIHTRRQEPLSFASALTAGVEKGFADDTLMYCSSIEKNQPSHCLGESAGSRVAWEACSYISWDLYKCLFCLGSIHRIISEGDSASFSPALPYSYSADVTSGVRPRLPYLRC